MRTATQIVDRVEDLWPQQPPPDDVLSQLVVASNLLGANRAVSNFGGGNTSAKGKAIDHAGRTSVLKASSSTSWPASTSQARWAARSASRSTSSALA